MIDLVLIELRKMRVKDVSYVTYMDIKSILKRLRLNKYYSCISHILDKIKEQEPINLNHKITLHNPDEQLVNEYFKKYLLQFNGRTVNDLLNDFFNKISNAFDDGLNHGIYGDRKCFFSYSYLIYKMVTTIIQHSEFSEETNELLFDLLSRLHILKSAQKLLAMDNIWNQTWINIDWKI